MSASANLVSETGEIIGEAVFPSLASATAVLRAGGVLGGVAGLIVGGFKCLELHNHGRLDPRRAAEVLGRDLCTGMASGVAASAASICVSAASATVGAVLCAPAWLPAATAVLAATGVGYLTNQFVKEAWDACIG